MKRERIYLDNSATTRPLPEVRDAMQKSLQSEFANPSSLHALGARAEERLEMSRRSVARLLQVRPAEIYFTSGATEANNTALRGAYRAFAHRGQHIVTSAIEHPSVRAVCTALQTEGADVTFLPADARGRIDPDNFREALREDTVLCSIMAVNNEVGSVQPLEEVSSAIADRPSPRPLLHVDAVQAIGRSEFSWTDLKCDLLSLSAHKFHGPKGAGALYVRRGLQIPPLMAGGGQERGLRSGTENTPAISGMAAASRWLTEGGADAYRALRSLRRRLAELILDALPDAQINGPEIDSPAGVSAPHILGMSFFGVAGEVLVHALAERGIYISTGAACSSRAYDHPGTLELLPVRAEVAETAVRFSLSPFNTQKEIEYTTGVLEEVVPALRRVSGRGGI